MWQTQIGLPEAIRDHPERWPFIVVMPQCSIDRYWTDQDMLAMAMSTLDQETEEFHGDPDRTYLSGLSLGGYGAWELARAISEALGGHCNCCRRHLLELRAGALAAGIHFARRVRAGDWTHADVAVSWCRRQGGGAAAG